MDDADGAAGIGFAISAFAMAVLGRRQWAIAEGYMPGRSTGPAPDMVSHETACILSANDEAARVRLTVYFADHEPAGPYLIDIGARRTLHVRFNDLTTPEPIPKDTDFSSVLESNVPVVVQHTRLDSRQAANALLTTMAFAGDR
jgi:hypothetical protein